CGDRKGHQYGLIVCCTNGIRHGQARIRDDAVVYELEENAIVLTQLPPDNAAAEGLAAIADTERGSLDLRHPQTIFAHLAFGYFVIVLILDLMDRKNALF